MQIIIGLAFMMPSLYVTPKIIFGPLEMMRHDTDKKLPSLVVYGWPN